ncbi:hypothetical protein [Nocardia vermiculata]|uniref:Uncharacterized protein n=1 Tax=Nocardia vermiculata TaxID=257274 RepID=A0A846XVM9_9NOCA|nr:hypothetical protein [Nocardia vermiculata]NKY49910.1 hypothetical protein [Nocardia vermiculata]
MRHRHRVTGGPSARRASRRPGGTGGTVRGGLVGATVVLLAMAAHGWAGGGYPGSTGATLLLLCGAVAGTLASALPVHGLRARAAVVAALGAGQGAAHLSLSLLHTHGGTEPLGDSGSPVYGPSIPGSWMMVAHAVATVVCALLIVAADRLYDAVSRAVRTVTTPLVLPARGVPARWPGSTPRPRQRLYGRALGSRAPPVPA